jgi:uncharacterized protein
MMGGAAMVTPEEIRSLTDRIVSAYRPERVVLFGSYASGMPREDSDVDLLVVMPYEGNALRKAAEIARDIDTPFAIDLIVRSPEELRQRLGWNDRFLRDIVEKGRVLYATTRH